MALTNVGSLGYGGQWLNTILPHLLIELQGHTISGPLTGAAANTAITVTDGIDIQDTVQKALLFTAGVPSDITSTISIVDLRAKGTLTLAGVVAGDVVTVNGKNYTAVALNVTPSTNIPPYQFPVGATDSITAQNLANALVSDDTITCTVATTVVTVIAKTEGTAGNSIALSAASSNGHVTASGSTLSGGSATNAIKSTSNTTSDYIILFWYKKDRNLLAA